MFSMSSPQASPFGTPRDDRPKPNRQTSQLRPGVAPSPGGYQQSDSYFPQQANSSCSQPAQPAMDQQQQQYGGQQYGQQYGQQQQGVNGVAQQMGQMGLDGAAGTVRRKKKDRHAHHTIETPASGSAFGANGVPPPVGGADPSQAPWQQTTQPWQSQTLPQPGTQLQPQSSMQFQPPGTPAGAPISMGNAQQPGQPPGAQRVNPDLIPSIPLSRDLPADHYKQHVYPTMEQRLPPPATTPYVAYDQGNASPKHARLTLNCIPNSQEQLATTGLPLGIVVQPLTRQADGETAIPVLDFGETGPPRCRRCRAYVNPFMVFSNGGNRMTCNLCGHPNEVAPEYFAPTDPSGIRVDRQDRPELLLGTCEYLVPKEYWSKEPVGMRYLFLLDVSAESCNRGFLKATCDGLLAALYGDDVEGEEEGEDDDDSEAKPTKSSKVPPGAKVGFMTFDREIHFFNVSSALSAPQQLVVSDLDDPFAAISAHHLFVDAADSKSNIVTLLQQLPTMFERIKHADPALLPSLQASLSALSETGGKIICSLASLPTHGPGRLTVRDRNMQTSTNDNHEQEKVLLRTENQSYKKLQADMVKAGVGIDFFLTAPAGGYLDIATIGLVSEKTGGDTFYYPNWAYPRDTLRLQKELSHAVQREQGFAALMKVRCSNGLQIAHYSGNFTQHTFGADLEMGSVTEDSALSVTFSYDGKLEVRHDAHFQSALLYTTASGQRRVRCTNVVATVTENARDSMRFVDQDAVLCVLAKEAASKVPDKSLASTRQELQDKTTDVLAAYRKHHSGSHPAGQLVMPEHMKEFAMYMLGLIKSRALKGGKEPSDRRVQELRMLKGMGPGELSLYLYPRVIAIHAMEPEEGFADENGHLKMPRGVRASFANIEEGGAYLVDNGQMLILWLHQLVSPNLLEDLFGEGFNELQKLDPNLNALPVLETHLNAQVRNVLIALEQGSGTGRGTKGLAIQLARQGLDGAEFEFARLLYEDRNGEASSYVDWLVMLHRSVSQELSGQRSKSSANDKNFTETISTIASNVPYWG
ncbi:putative Zinc finger, Sec23/Sec24-type, sec23/Sec24, trunk domain, sec23/Sec24, helical [Septoria linicola]|nr:putative Zinc finger, Sec23/Sec24-type, sec23/Sec24, trunk domain, sec23/Sec24, helical [Septoria linicola]